MPHVGLGALCSPVPHCGRDLCGHSLVERQPVLQGLLILEEQRAERRPQVPLHMGGGISRDRLLCGFSQGFEYVSFPPFS